MKQRNNFLIRISFLLQILLFMVVHISQSYAQDIPPKPTACITPPASFELGGAFFMPTSYCTTPEDPNKIIKAVNIKTSIGDLNSAKYIFNLDFDVDITASNLDYIDATMFGTSLGAEYLMTPGVHWVMQIGELGGTQYVSCNTVEIIRTDPPVANIYTCNGTSIHIDIEDNPNNKHDQYKIDWGDGQIDLIDVNSSQPLPFTDEHAYSGDLSQVSITGYYYRFGYGVCETNPVVKNSSSSTAPLLNSLTILPDGAEIGFKNYAQDKEYTIQFTEENHGIYDWKDLGQASNGSYTASGLEEDKEYCYRIKTLNFCDDTVFSNIICGIGLTAAQSSSNSVDLSWKLPPSPTGTPLQLELARDINGCDSCFTVLPIGGINANTFTDSNLDCDKTYNYTVRATFGIEMDGVTETILIQSSTLDHNPLDGNVSLIPNGLLNVSFPVDDESMVKLIVTDNEVNVEEYHYFHKGNSDSDFISIGKSGNSFEDIAIKASSGAYCYKYKIEDACNILSDPSPKFCTVFLSYQGNTLNWTENSYPNTIITSSPAEFTIELYDETIGAFLPQFITTDLEKGVGNLISASLNPTLKFRILAKQFIDIEGFTNFSIPSYSNTIVVPVPIDVFIPSAFSPNGDGRNDTFEIKSKFINKGTITIYDRWGAVLFNSELADRGWSGKDLTESEWVPAGNYSYRIRGISDAGQGFSRNGTVTLLR